MFDPAVRHNRTGQWSYPQFSYDSAQVIGVKSESQWRRKTCFHSLPSYICSSSLLKTKSNSIADALLSQEMGCGCRRRRTNLTVLYMVVKGEDVCYMAVR